MLDLLLLILRVSRILPRLRVSEHIPYTRARIYNNLRGSSYLIGFRQSHIRDGVALVRYFAWLEETLQDGNKEGLTEYQVAEKLEVYRSCVFHCAVRCSVLGDADCDLDVWGV